MAQEINVLKCAVCNTFQSQIVKKTRKWECKVCGSKQSIKKVYGRGSGKDCRLHTQKLNDLQGERDSTNKNKHETAEEYFAMGDNHIIEDKNLLVNDSQLCDFSKWAEYTNEEQLSDSKMRNHETHNFDDDVDVKITSSSSVKKRKYISEQRLYNVKRCIHLTTHTDLNEEIKNKIFSQTNHNSIDFKDKIIKTQSRKGEISQTKRGKYLKVEPNTHVSNENNGHNGNEQTQDICMNFDVNRITHPNLSNQAWQLISKDKESVSDVQCFSKNTNVTNKHQSNQKLFPSQYFECNTCNLTDVDFQLDF